MSKNDAVAFELGNKLFQSFVVGGWSFFHKAAISTATLSCDQSGCFWRPCYSELLCDFLQGAGGESPTFYTGRPETWAFRLVEHYHFKMLACMVHTTGTIGKVYLDAYVNPPDSSVRDSYSQAEGV